MSAAAAVQGTRHVLRGARACSAALRRVRRRVPCARRARSSAFVALVSFALAACATDEALPELPMASFAAVERGCEGSEACLAAGVTDATVAGVRVIHRPLPGAPITALRLFFDGGASLWTPVSVHAEGFLFRLIRWWGSAERPGAAFDAEVARIGGRFGASQGLDFSHVSIVAPSTEFDAAFDLLRAAAVEPPLPSDEAGLAHVRGVQQSAIDTLYEEPAGAAAQTAWDLLYAGHPYDLRVESADRLADVTLSDVRAAERRLAREGGVVLVVVGDVERERVEAAVAQGLAPLEAGPGLDATLPPVMPSTRVAEVLDYPDSPSWHVRGYFAAPAPDDADFLPLLLGLSVLDDRLFDALRTERALVYTAGAALSDLRANYGSVWLSTDRPAEALATFHEVLGAIQVDGPTEEELETARALYLTDFFSANATASGMAWTLGAWTLQGGAPELADARVAQLEDVTTAEVTDALARYLPGLRLVAAGAGEPLTEAMLLGPLAP